MFYFLAHVRRVLASLEVENEIGLRGVIENGVGVSCAFGKGLLFFSFFLPGKNFWVLSSRKAASAFLAPCERH